ncbi:MAG: VCBS repeat-containing protein [Planctomycetes bacterium]|nr:VCBS repeat-containing protein [Planctomycetota bacterium]
MRPLLRACLGAALAAAVPAQEATLGTIGPLAEVVEARTADTDGDGRTELVVVARDGTVLRYGFDGTALVRRGGLRLRDPGHTLFALVDLAPAAGVELVVADPSGTAWLPWPVADAVSDAAPVPLVRRARLSLRTDAPLRSPFVQDLDRDGRLDLLLPTLQGVLPFVQEAPADDGAPRFRALPLLPVPVTAAIEHDPRRRSRELAGSLVVPQLETEDLNGDGRADLLTREDQRRSFWLLGDDGGFRAPITLDLEQFRDSTPKAAVELGSTLVVGDRQLLQRGDVDGDGIPDFVIAHRRKVWTFLASRDGPQFTKARTQAVADDVTAMLLVDLDEDRRHDLLTFQLQLPGVGALLLGLVQSIDIDVKCVGYRSEGPGFANLPAWRRTVTLRIPPVLTLLGQQEELVQRFLDIVGKTRLGVRGAFAAGASNDLALVRSDGSAIERFAGDDAPPRLDSARGRRILRELLFEDPATVFDLERVFALVSGFVDELSGSLVGDRTPRATLPLRDPTQWRVVDLQAADFDGAPGDELVVVYAPADGDETAPRVYDLLRWPAVAPR